MVDTPFTRAAPAALRLAGDAVDPRLLRRAASRASTRARAPSRAGSCRSSRSGSDVPYALNVDLRSDTVWICGTNSDRLIRFEPASERFTVYPLPTRVTYTRELDFDAEGRVWTSNSNAPTWQIEGGYPRVLRLDPDGAGERVAGAR